VVILYPALFLWGFWALYVLVMGLYRAQLAGRLSLPTKIMGAPFLVMGLLVDVLANIAVASIAFAEMPRELLVTSRLRRYIAGPDGWRKARALVICTQLLDPFDPSNNHCNRPA
jgi:hypothetical protein